MKTRLLPQTKLSLLPAAILLLLMLVSSVGWGQTQTTVTITKSDNPSSPWTVPANVQQITVKVWGAGGGSGGHGTIATAGSNGGNTIFGTYEAGGGKGSAGAINNSPTTGGAGGTATQGTFTYGSDGTIGYAGTNNNSQGGSGGSSPNGGSTIIGTIITGNGKSVAGLPGNFPGGGAAGSARSANDNTARSTGGGGGGAYTYIVIDVIEGDEFDYSVGSGGAAGTGNQANGAAGADGKIEISYTLPECTNASLTLTSEEGTDNQDVCLNSAITEITYSVGGDATGATVTGLPNGVIGTFSNGILTINGTPTEDGTYIYTVITTGTPDGCDEATSEGTLTVGDDLPPTFSAPADITIYSDANCLYNSAVTATGDVTDEADIYGVGQATYSDVIDNSNPCAIVIRRTWSLVDNCGNAAADQIQTITIQDNTAPVISTLAEALDATLECSDTQGLTDALALAPAATDNCTDEPTLNLVSDVTTPDATCDNAYVRVRTWNFSDGCGNTSADFVQTITIQDNTAPVITVPSTIEVYYDPTICGTVVTYEVTADDNCSGEIIPTLKSGPESGSKFPFGTTTITWEAVDECGNTSEKSFDIVVKPAVTTSTLTVTPTSQQYSDLITLKVVITNGYSECGDDAATGVDFYIGGQKMNSNPVDFEQIENSSDMIAEITVPLLEDSPDLLFGDGVMNPGAKEVSAKLYYTNTTLYDIEDPATTTLTIIPEDARIVYTGDMIKAAESTNATSVTFDLIANIYDITADRFSSDPESDTYAGDIRNAKVRFINREGASNVVLDEESWYNVSDLIVEGDSRMGTIMVPGGLTISGLSNSNPSRQITIGIEVAGYYTRDEDQDDIVITAYLPNGDFITGGGYLVTTNSEGRKASDDDKKVSFGFNVKFNKTGKNLQGSMNIIFRRTEVDGRVHNYQIKANAMQSLGVNVTNPESMTAEYVSKVSVKDLNSSNSNGDLDLGGNKMLYVKMVDNGEPGANDKISFVLVNGSDNPNVLSNIIWSSHWVGDMTEMMNLAGGNLVVHSGFSVGSASTASTSKKVAEVDIVAADTADNLLKAYPNPFAERVFFDMQFVNDGHAVLEIFDMRGAKLSTLFDKSVEAGMIYRLEYAPTDVVPGILIYRLVKDGEVTNGRLIYQKQR